MSTSRFPSIREAFKRDHGHGKTEEEFERLWQECKDDVLKAVSAYPPLEEDRVYGPAEQRAMHWLQATQYSLAGPPKAKPKAVPTLAGTTDVLAMKPKDFVAALQPNVLTNLPSHIPIASVRTAAYNQGVRIKTRFQAGKWYVMKRSSDIS